MAAAHNSTHDNIMNGRAITVIFSALLVIVRSIVLLGKKEYRMFPICFFFFAGGGIGFARGIRRYLDLDTTLLPGSRGGQAWYQDLVVGLLLAVGAVVYCAYNAKTKKNHSEAVAPPVNADTNRAPGKTLHSSRNHGQTHDLRTQRHMLSYCRLRGQTFRKNS